MKTLVAILLATYGLNSFAEGIGAGGPPTDAPSSSAEALQRVVESLNIGGGDYRDEISGKWKKARGLYQIPTDNALGLQKSVCHSFHHKPDYFGNSTPPTYNETVDTYTDELAGCAYMAVLQEWRKTYCKADAPSGCQVSLGDVSHKEDPNFNGLKTHKDGRCFNIRPMQLGKYEDKVVNYETSQKYDHKMTRMFIDLLREKGARRIHFNDPATTAMRARGMEDVINVCFDANDTVKKTCQNFKYDAAICGEPGTF